MKKTIVAVGANENLGRKIIDVLLNKGAEIIEIVRLETVLNNKIYDLAE